MVRSDILSDKVLYLVRHGRAESNRSGIFAGWGPDPLLPEGRAQAEKAAHALKGYGVEALFSSPVKRARETAEIIASHLGLGVSLMDGVGDIRVPEWEGRFKSELLVDASSQYRLWKEAPELFNQDGALKDSESLGACQARSVAAVEALFDSERFRVAAVITHLCIVRCILLHYLGRPLSDYRKIEINNGFPLALVKKDGHIVIYPLLKMPIDAQYQDAQYQTV